MRSRWWLIGLILLGALGSWLYLNQIGTGRRGSTPEDAPPREPAGSWHWTRGEEDTGDTEEALDRTLQGLGYLAGYETAPRSKGVVRHRPDSSRAGLNLYVSGHAPAAYLMTMEGEILHRWKVPWKRAFPGKKPASYLEGPYSSHHWRNVHLYPDGTLLAIVEGHGLVRVNRASEVIWSKQNHAHHDVAVAENGEIYVITSHETNVPVKDNPVNRLDDVIEVYSPEGVLKRKHSILEALKNSPYRSMLRYLDGGDQEFFHTNSLKFLPESGLPEAWRGGDLLLSFNRLSSVAVMDLDRPSIVWMLAGMTATQHDASFLEESGHLLMLDNGRLSRSSRVVELVPGTHRIVWEYGGSDARPFYTACCGTAQRLPGGNTLITDTTSGRAFEVTSRGEVVWEFVSPHRAGENDELVASLFEMRRYPRSFFEGWLPRAGGASDGGSE